MSVTFTLKICNAKVIFSHSYVTSWSQFWNLILRPVANGSTTKFIDLARYGVSRRTNGNHSVARPLGVVGVSCSAIKVENEVYTHVTDVKAFPKQKSPDAQVTKMPEFKRHLSDKP